jgi:hypothetical protein
MPDSAAPPDLRVGCDRELAAAAVAARVMTAAPLLLARTPRTRSSRPAGAGAGEEEGTSEEEAGGAEARGGWPEYAVAAARLPSQRAQLLLQPTHEQLGRSPLPAHAAQRGAHPPSGDGRPCCC